MRVLYLVFITTVALLALLLAAAPALRAQEPQPAMVGMPEYGVSLGGTPEHPVIENHSGRVIIGYNIETADANGRIVRGVGQILAPSVLPEGLPDGKSLYAMGYFPVDSNLKRGGRAVNTAARLAVRATLTCLIFGDGHFVGADERGAFERLGKQLKAVKEVGNLAKTGAWDQIDALAQAFGQMPRQPPPPEEDPDLYTFRQLAASRLVATWRPKDDVAAARAAVQLAEIYAALPTVWK